MTTAFMAAPVDSDAVLSSFFKNADGSPWSAPKLKVPLGSLGGLRPSSSTAERLWHRPNLKAQKALPPLDRSASSGALPSLDRKHPMLSAMEEDLMGPSIVHSASPPPSRRSRQRPSTSVPPNATLNSGKVGVASSPSAASNSRGTPVAKRRRATRKTAPESSPVPRGSSHRLNFSESLQQPEETSRTASASEPALILPVDVAVRRIRPGDAIQLAEDSDVEDDSDTERWDDLEVEAELRAACEQLLGVGPDDYALEWKHEYGCDDEEV